MHNKVVTCGKIINMEYSKLVSVTGMSGLFELLSSKADGAVVKNLEDGSSKFVSSRVHNFSHLDSIEVYTTTDNVNLVEVLTAIKASGVALPDANDAKAVKSYFEKVYPTMDFERVYNSDMKKMIKWYAVLEKNNVELKLSENKIEDDGEAKTKHVETKAAALKNAPAKKINSPRKMA
jgi:hypothetical protein